MVVSPWSSLAGYIPSRDFSHASECQSRNCHHCMNRQHSSSISVPAKYCASVNSIVGHSLTRCHWRITLADNDRDSRDRLLFSGTYPSKRLSFVMYVYTTLRDYLSRFLGPQWIKNAEPRNGGYSNVRVHSGVASIMVVDIGSLTTKL